MCDEGWRLVQKKCRRHGEETWLKTVILYSDEGKGLLCITAASVFPGTKQELSKYLSV